MLNAQVCTRAIVKHFRAISLKRVAGREQSQIPCKRLKCDYPCQCYTPVGRSEHFMLKGDSGSESEGGYFGPVSQKMSCSRTTPWFQLYMAILSLREHYEHHHHASLLTQQ